MTVHLPDEFPVAALLHRMAGGGSAPAIIQQIADETLTSMHSPAGVVSVVLGEPDIGFVVHATARAPGVREIPTELALTGPGLTAATTGAMTTVNDMRAPDQRWSVHAGLAVARGLLGVRCWSIQVGLRPVGALVVHTEDAWGSTRSNATGHAFADLCAVALQLPAENDRWVQAASQVNAALMDEVSTHQATGMVAAGLGIGIRAAAERVDAHAARIGVSRVELSRRLVEGSQRPDDVG